MAKITAYARLFGSGPPGSLLSLGLLALAFAVRRRIGPAPLFGQTPPRVVALTLGVAITAVLIVWSLRSLPPRARGRSLCTAGAYRWVRHPLYAAFLSVFNFGLALYLNDWIFLAWAVLLHPLWHLVVRPEERSMAAIFGEEYLRYARRTGRFVPRLRS